MDFSEKLYELRREKGLTQEELAKTLFVSRTAVSKWESGRGYPSIDSLKTIATFFEITVDELLSSNQLLTIAEKESKQREKHFRGLVFGLLDLVSAMLFFLPLFRQQAKSGIQGASLLYITEISTWLKVLYLVVVTLIVLFGILAIVFKNCEHDIWVRIKDKASLLLGLVGVSLFVAGLQPYAATFLLVILAIKVLIVIKRQ